MGVHATLQCTWYKARVPAELACLKLEVQLLSAFRSKALPRADSPLESTGRLTTNSLPGPQHLIADGMLKLTPTQPRTEDFTIRPSIRASDLSCTTLDT